MQQFREARSYDNLIEPLLLWYPEHHRDLPWRQTEDPYRIWLSEIMLQQTRVEAVKPYYKRFLEALPTIEALSSCPEDQLMKLWEGLGYYSRVRNLQKAAQVIMRDYDGRMPANYEEILSLPGIGAYTAGAISSIAFHLPEVAVDGNVLRILTRATCDERIIDEEKTKKTIRQELMESAISIDLLSEIYGTLNQAMMELGATVCVPNGKPNCEVCPWKELCKAKAENRIEEFPYRKEKKARRVEEKTVLLIRDGSRVLVRKRPEKGLLSGLYEYPNLEGFVSDEDVIEFTRSYGLDPLYLKPLPDAKHIFSHVEWHMKGVEIRVADLSSQEEKRDILAEMETVRREYAIPSAFRVYNEYLKDVYSNC